jgi:SRSO17 transposase
VLGLLADLPRKNCWSIAEHAGDRDPHGMQYLLARASWDTDGVRDDLRDYVVGALGDTDAVLVFDETGDLKKGTCTVGTQRQYTGTAGRIENAQVAVYLTYAAARGHTLIDRELYLPQSWIADPQRLTDAGVPDDIDFLTKPALATGMLTRALRAGTPARWVAGDEVYGNDPGLRAECEAQRIGYVLAIGCDRRVLTPAGPVRADDRHPQATSLVVEGMSGHLRWPARPGHGVVPGLVQVGGHRGQRGDTVRLRFRRAHHSTPMWQRHQLGELRTRGRNELQRRLDLPRR